MLLPRPADSTRWGAAPSSGWPATLVVWGPGDVSSMHAHHASHLIFARQGVLRVRVGEQEAEKEAAGVFVPSDRPHAVDASESEVVIAFVDPQSEQGAGLIEALGTEVVLFDQARRDGLLHSLPRPGLDPAQLDAWLDGLFPALGAKPRRARVHPKIGRVLEHLRKGAPGGEGTSVAALSRVAGLSESRFLHAFTESVGIPSSAYLLWLRLMHAAQLIGTRATFTEAAHAAGFSDAAHMSRTFRRMFGSTPSAMVERSRSVQVAGGRDGAP